MAVLMASIGAAIVVYGSKNSFPITEDPDESIIDEEDMTSSSQPKAPLIGNLLTLLASVIYAFYQVGYKEYAALENEPEPILDDYERLPTTVLSYESSEHTTSASPIASIVSIPQTVSAESDKRAVYPPPFGFHPDFLISAVGVSTFCVLWILLPILHYTDVETFRLPPDLWTYSCIAVVGATGIMFNASFMVRSFTLLIGRPDKDNSSQILLGVWGPIVTSVGNLLTIVLVLISDMVLVGVTASLTFWRLLGSGMIICSFAILAYDT